FGEEIMDEEQWQDSIDAWKLSFLVPLIEKVLPNQNNPVEFQAKISNFLKSAINGNFLSSEDVVLPPIVRLNRFLVKQMCEHPTSEIFDDLKQTITNYCLLIQQVEEPSDTVKYFLLDVVKVFKNPIEMLRLLALKWLSLDDTYLLKQCAIDPEFKMILLVAIYLERFDLDENCVELATNLWGLLRFIEIPEMHSSILNETIHHEDFVQSETAEVIRELASEFPELINVFFNGLFDFYKKYLIIVPEETDNVGRMVKPAYDPIIERIGISKALIRLADIIPLNMTQKFVEEIGEKLNEHDGRVHSNLRSAAIVVIKRHGQQCIGTLLPYLETKLTNAPKTEDGDHIRQGLVVLMGTLGMYLGNEPNRVVQIFKTLIEALSTPSESVQRSVANCLPGLVGFIETESIETLEQLLHIMEVSDNYGDRRGAAYGIAAIVRGLRACVIVDVNLLKKIENMVTSKSNANQRESALLIMELLFVIMGHESEPFMPGFIPYLLLTYGDNNAAVRKATADAGSGLMAALSPYGAK
uniref:Uncharacterized protein n=1 Tax=Panagrolaimus sp. JU765 TaxID=591449 RepID=A0AC34R7U8_9BILA